jgi:release factor glutamine methyltransferase
LADVVERLRAAGCVFAEDEAALITEAARSPGELESMVGRRAGGLPLEQVLGWAEFCGLRIDVEPGVFVPRRRTELLVREAAALAPDRDVVVDLCCGSGAIGAALGARELHAVDLDPVAVRCARANLPHASVYQGDLYEPLPAGLRGRVDVIAANVPYVPSAELALLPHEAREHEPRMALDGGPDGLGLLRRVAAGAPPWLARRGALLSETSEEQAPAATEILAGAGLEPRVARDAELDATVVVGVRMQP